MYILEPKLIIIASYGIQQNTFGTSQADVHVNEIFGQISNWLNEGARILWAGDQNLSIGTELLPGNDIYLSPSGKLFNNLMSRQKYEDFIMEDVWKARIRELERIQEELAAEKDPDKIHKSRTLIERATRNQVITSIKDDNGETLESVEEIYNHILK